jgi:hypothetical protein
VKFEDAEIRRHWDERKEKWYLSIVDIIGLLTGTDRPRKYWNDLKTKLKIEGSELSDKIGRLKLIASDGKLRDTDVADVETILRVIQSVPSPKAEPLKQWLAKVGYERIEEIKDPEKAIHRAIGTYSQKGYDDEWIDRRIRTIEVRNELTREWKKRGIEQPLDFAILTNEVYKGWSGLSSKEYKKHKGLKDENLRDHMTNLELVLNMLAEASTAELARNKDAQGIQQNKTVAQEGSQIAGNARKELEAKTGKPIVTKKNHLPASSNKQQLT